MLIEELPFEKNWTMRTGTSFEIEMRWLPENEPFDFTGSSAVMILSRDREEDTLIEYTTESGEITLDSDGWIRMALTPTQVDHLSSLDVPRRRKQLGILNYALTIAFPLGNIDMFIFGQLYIEYFAPRVK